MATLFTKIIQGDLPGRFVWRDDVSVAFLTIAPLRPGHTLVVPRTEVDDWLDLDVETSAHLMEVAQAVGLAQRVAFEPRRVGMIIAGLEVPHVHLHVVPIRSEADLSFAKVDHEPSEDSLDNAAAKLREVLRHHDHSEVADR